jgi:hypothetical protein
MKIKKSILAKIIREAVEAADYNVQAAIDRAKDRGHTDAEISSVVDASKRDEEIIMMLDLLDSDEYPDTSKEKD